MTVIASEPEFLLVEDSPTDAELFIRTVNKHRLGIRISWVKDGAEALDFLFTRGAFAGRTSGPPEIVILDLRLPKLNGLQVLTAMRGDDRTKLIPVVILTSSTEDPDLAEAYKLGARVIVSKPVEFDQFVDAVSKLGFSRLAANRTPVHAMSAPTLTLAAGAAPAER